MPLVTSIDLQSNRISVVERPALQVFPKLDTLLLGHNQLWWLPRDAFRDSPLLHVLDLSHNPFRSPPRLHVPTLAWFGLSHCGLTQLPSDMFRNTPLLETIRLDHNALLTLDNNLFAKLKRLAYLHLEKNKIMSLDPNIFQFNPNFRWLNISENSLQLPENGSFLNAHEIDVLDIGHCNLKKIPEQALANLNRLRQLRLNGNQLSSLDGAIFKSLEAVQDLELQDNQILHMDFLQYFGNLTYLDMAYNELTSLDLEAFRTIPMLRFFFVTGNPLTCNCGLAEALNWCVEQQINTAFDDDDCREELNLLKCDVLTQSNEEPHYFPLHEMQTSPDSSKNYQQPTPFLLHEKESEENVTESYVNPDVCRTTRYLAILLGLAACLLTAIAVGLALIYLRMRRLHRSSCTNSVSLDSTQ